MNTVDIEGDGGADERKSYIRTPNLHRHDSHIVQMVSSRKGCIVIPLLFIQQAVCNLRECVLCASEPVNENTQPQ